MGTDAFENIEGPGDRTVVNIPITIDENNINDGARQILKVIRPSWNYENIKFKIVSICYTEPLSFNMGTDAFENIEGPGDRTVVNIPITIDENNINDGARQILKVIRPSWNYENIKFKVFTDGITNKLIGCFRTPQSLHTQNYFHDETATDNACAKDVVLVRVYGNNTDMLIDRKAETRNIKLLHTYGFAPSLFATFKNGLAYEYVPGVTLTSDSVIEPKIWKLIAKRMAEMHKVTCDLHIKKVPCLKPKVLQFLALLPDTFSDNTNHERVRKTFTTTAKLKEEFLNLYEILENLKSPVVFAHNDLLLGNVIYTDHLKKVTFIDFEYAGYNYQAFDIGNHFCEYAGIDNIDYSRYPDKQFQLRWLRVYLQNFDSSKDVTNDDVEDLYVVVNKFALASHFLWAVWALIQVEHSKIDFDFVQFAEARYNEYLTKKDEFLALN